MIESAAEKRTATLAGTQVLIVDDNKGYRDAFRRNLLLRGYDVKEAEDSQEALEVVQASQPDVVVTDLAMRHPTEGLDLIRQVRSLRPHLPVIMISAVGTFDEGAEASRLGACQVISKSKIDEEIGRLYEAIDSASRQYAAVRGYLSEFSALGVGTTEERSASIAALNAMLRREEIPPAIKGEIFDKLTELNLEGEGRGATGAAGEDIFAGANKDLLGEVENILAKEIPGFSTFEDDTRQNLMTAEFLYQQNKNARPGVDFSRSMGFAYCFAVENEAKSRMRKKLQKFFSDAAMPKLVEGLLESNRRSLSIFYQQYLLRLQRDAPNEATIENYFHTFSRMLEHRGKYRPDGLKALGMVVIAFGRTYQFKKFNQDVAVDNPLGLREFEEADAALKFASLLINLQHYRNPYIHPEISEMTKISKIRETAFACLNYIAAIQ